MKHDYTLSDDWKINYLESQDGILVRYGLYAKTEKTNFAIVFINGRNEFIEKYKYLPENLQIPSSCAFLTWDHRGQGDTNFKKGHIDSYDQYVDDAHHIIHKVLGNTPYIIVAHSMGSLVSLYGAMNHKLLPQKLILFSPFLGFPLNTKIAYLLHGMISLLVNIGFSRTDWPFFKTEQQFSLNKLTQSKEKFTRLLASPYVSHSMTFGWLHSSYKAIKLVWNLKNISKLQKPIQILVPENEKVVSLEACHLWAQRAKKIGRNINIHTIKKAKHEILNDEGEIYQEALEIIRTSLI